MVHKNEIALLVLGFLKNERELFPETLKSFLKEATDIGEPSLSNLARLHSPPDTPPSDAKPSFIAIRCGSEDGDDSLSLSNASSHGQVEAKECQGTFSNHREHKSIPDQRV